MQGKVTEISSLLKERIANFTGVFDIAETGRVLSVSDGIARVFGLMSPIKQQLPPCINVLLIYL
jgi:F0F1-type ATP synthase alpha subunit